MTLPSLMDLEAEARRRDLLLRLQVARPLGLLWSLRLGVARRRDGERLVLLGDLKAWALPTADGLRIDSLQVAGRERGEPDLGVGPLITAACFAWALETTPCRGVRFLAIRDDARQHRRLVRYFRRLGFTPERELGSGPLDLPQRLVWGGAGLLMQGNCGLVLERCAARLQFSPRA